MIYGKTSEQAHNDAVTWQLWFAWRPVRLIDGRRVWLETIQRKWTAIEGGWDGPWWRRDYRTPQH